MVVVWDLDHGRLSLSLPVVLISLYLGRVDNLTAQVIGVLAQRAMCLREVNMARRRRSSTVSFVYIDQVVSGNFTANHLLILVRNPLCVLFRQVVDFAVQAMRARAGVCFGFATLERQRCT